MLRLCSCLGSIMEIDIFLVFVCFRWGYKNISVQIWKPSCFPFSAANFYQLSWFEWLVGFPNHLYFVPLFLLKSVFLKGNLSNAPPQKSRKWYAVPNIRTKPEILPGMNLKTKQILYLGKLKFLFFQWKSVCREMAKLGGITWHL